ncbi:ciliated left-right organizer protein containing ZP-N domains homolog [Genypterus blacodes]|uniref:ciliated left-right organizer protein containing ZP-N domains homolog n=1 Tax=Genypterus blacodes TaxID=154954 RepID=UPI003F777119
MDVWMHSEMFEALALWFSRTLQVEVTVASLDLQLSACGFSLHKDAEENFLFRASYTGCLIQQQHGYNVLTLNLVKRINGFGGRAHTVMMKCPVVSVVPDKEHIQCDPEFIQVTRQIPHDSWNNELPWSLSLRDHLVVALEDSSLIQINTDMLGADVTVQGRRREILSPVTVMENEGEFLALKLVSGQYAYSLEATCPKESTAADDVVLHIFKRRMGLTRRGSSDSEALTVTHVSLQQTDEFTVNQTSDFVTLLIPIRQILQSKACTGDEQLQQPFYRLDVVLTFKETNHQMHWSMENTLPCTDGAAVSSITPLPAAAPRLGSAAESLPSERRSSVPTGKPNKAAEESGAEFSTAGTPYVPTQAAGSGFHTDNIPLTESVNETITSTNATESDYFSVEFETNTTTTTQVLQHR